MDVKQLTFQDHPDMKRSIQSKAGAFSLWLEFEHWLSSPNADPTNDFFNMHIRFEDGRTYALNVWTFDYLASAYEELKADREQETVVYLPAPDLFVEKLDREYLEVVVKEMVEHGQLAQEWLVDVDSG